MTEPTIIDGVPEDLRAILDQAAGKEHSATGPVMACLAEILTAHKKQIRAEFATEWAAILQEMREDGNVDLRTPIHMLRDIARGES
jgi:hypothetical protein